MTVSESSDDAPCVKMTWVGGPRPRHQDGEGLGRRLVWRQAYFGSAGPCKAEVDSVEDPAFAALLFGVELVLRGHWD